MKFQVSVLSDKGVKKLIATVEADYFVEERGNVGRNAIFGSGTTRILFWTEDDMGWWSKLVKVVVASVVVYGSYVVEQVSL